MTSNVQLQKYINQKKHLLRNRNFLGIFPSDELPIVNSINACCIINYSPHNITDHGHWVAVMDLNTKNKSPYYFDSYGFPPDADDDALHVKTNIKDWILKNSSTGTYDYNKYDFQAYTGSNADVCGEFAVTAILYGEPSRNIPIWNKLMSTSSAIDRDRIIRQYVGIVPVQN